ncbi:hypothetical protein RND81_05G262100 [Saponaria officinalis]|uniref:Uncharacterized protein n=1 Tax=Saponaria officinalis TaxID=3572 RepID=A0AAW1L413_SAPOF
MGIDVNDLKILINASFKYLIKTCHQWAKDHPLVSGVLLFFYLLYIFFPNLFSILFYTFPLIICIAIILGGKHISSKQNQEQIKNNKKYDILRSMTIDHRRRRHLNPQMRSMTLGRTDGLLSHDEIKDHIEQFPTNTKSFVEHTTEQTSRPTSTGISSHSDTESQEEEENEDEEGRQARDKVVEWTEDDQRNLMDLGSSEIERNKRLESLIAKRRARKQLSMQPRRAHYPYENLMDQIGTIMVSRCIDHDAEHQPGSAPCVLRPTRNPFDLPYDPHEEKPVLTGGSFDDEFFSNEQKELLEECLGKHDGFVGDVMDDSKSFPSFFTRPKSVEKPGFSRFRRASEEGMREILDELSKQDARNEEEPNQQDSSENVQLRTSLSLPNEEHHGLENPFAKDFDTSKSDSTSSSEMINKDELQTKDNNNEENVLHIDSEETITPVEIQASIQEHESMNKDRDDDQDSTSSVSSSSSSTEMTINAIKNEAFRNSVKKVLTCLVIQRQKGNTSKENTFDNATTSNGLLFDPVVPNITTPTKMEERSFYTNRPHHTTTFSIASDMQVEVSDTGSPPLATLDPGSPTDRESLVYDGDVDKDANSGDEDLWGASPHPVKQGDFATKFKLPDITEEGHDIKESSFRGDHIIADERPSSLEGKEIDQDQRSIDAEIIGSMSSASSSSDGLMSSQMQAKSEHLAEYLANLPPTQSGSNALEEPEPSLVRAQSAEEQAIFELDETKDELRESEEMGESREGSGEQSIVASETRAPSETDSISREYIEGDFDSQAKFMEDEPSLNDHGLLEKDEKEVICDSMSTTCEEEILEQSRLEEGVGTGKLEEDMKIPNDGEVDENSINDPLIHDKSTFVEKPTDDQENNGHILIENTSEIEEQISMKNEVKLRGSQDTPQQATIEDDNMHPKNDPQDNVDHPKT